MKGRSLRSKMMWIVMLTTATALLLSAASLLFYEVSSFRNEWRRDLSAQAEVLAGTVTPALTFDDAKTAHQSLALMSLRPQVERAALYDRQGRLFARYVSPDAPDPNAAFPAAPASDGSRFQGERQDVFFSIRADGELLGTVYLKARHDLTARVLAYLGILVGVMAVSLALAMLLFTRLQRAVTEPILAVARVANHVMQRGDYSQRVPRRSDDEVGELVEAFNSMLAHLSAEMAERERAEAALRMADRRKDEFLATLAHELRNPLAPMANALQLLQRAADKPELAELKERSRAIMERQVRQMTRLVDDLLEVSRITTGKLELRASRIDLRAALDAALEITEPAVRGREHQLHYERPPRALWVQADLTRLSQVFVNLINNAAKYTPPAGRIHVEVDVAHQAPAGTVTVRVADYGLGIEPSMQHAIFDMFVQVDQSLERGSAGLGIGLTLARQLVEMHGGTLAVRSEGKARGSVFSVTLPLAASQAHPAEAAVPAPEPARPRRRILLADDNQDFAASLAELLEMEGHEVRVVHDGAAALAAALAWPPELALLDIGMPLINGLDLARRLRAEPSTHGAMLVAITGWSQPADREAVRAAGFDRHLVKPASPQEVLGVVAELPVASSGDPG